MAEPASVFSYTARDEAATQRCAGWLAQAAEAGCLVFLDGDLGAGKTAFARGFIRAKTGPTTVVPSPSFTLMQPYEQAVPPVVHCDFYRLAEAQEVEELGLADLLDSHVCLIEWAARGADTLPAPQIRVTLTPQADATRRIDITADAAIVAALEAAAARDAALDRFLATAGWGDADRAALAGDASTRRYERLTSPDGRPAVLMDWAKGPDGPPVYAGKPYSRVAQLAEAMPAYCRMVDWLQANGLAAPAVLARDEAQGFALMEDFGDRHIAADAAIDRPVFYAEAVATLLHLHTLPAAGFLPAYDGAVQAVEAGLFTEWYLPHQGLTPDAAALADWQQIWQRLGDGLVAAATPVTVLRDFHSVNLLWRDAAQARWRIGLIDVQDALAGHAAYDLASLLCDARLDVDAALAARLLDVYCSARFGADAAARDDFLAAYALCAVQRNLKIAGIFVRLAERDNKPGYLKHLPRVLSYIRAHLGHPALQPVAAWLDTHAPLALEPA